MTLLHRLSSLKVSPVVGVFCFTMNYFSATSTFVSQILGDYTPGKETVLLDNVKISTGPSNGIPAACYAEMQPFAYRR